MLLQSSEFVQKVEQVWPNAYKLPIDQDIMAWCSFPPCIRQALVACFNRGVHDSALYQSIL
jgi:hypothetical protein